MIPETSNNKKEILKNKLKSIPACNSKLNFDFYKRFSDDNAAYNKLCEEMHSIDSLQDTSALKAFVKDVKEGRLPYWTNDANVSNCSIYGIWQSVFKGADKQYAFKYPAVEHGLNFYDSILTDLRFTARPAVATFGDFRKAIIKKYKHCPVFTVGPYINYAEPYYSDVEFKTFKEKLGKALLVFPAHTIESTTIDFSIKDYLRQIAAIAKDFDTVLVNAFWWNINDSLFEACEAEGYRVVSAGFRDDTHFLSRLRTTIEASDLVVGNGSGTHVGYILSLGKRFQLIDCGTTLLEPKVENASKQRILEHENGIKRVLHDIDTLEAQKEALEPYWGFSHVRSRENLSKIIEISADIDELSHHWTFRNAKAAKVLLQEYKDADSCKYELLKEALS